MVVKYILVLLAKKDPLSAIRLTQVSKQIHAVSRDQQAWQSVTQALQEAKASSAPVFSEEQRWENDFYQSTQPTGRSRSQLSTESLQRLSLSFFRNISNTFLQTNLNRENELPVVNLRVVVTGGWTPQRLAFLSPIITTQTNIHLSTGRLRTDRGAILFVTMPTAVISRESFHAVCPRNLTELQTLQPRLTNRCVVVLLPNVIADTKDLATIPCPIVDMRTSQDITTAYAKLANTFFDLDDAAKQQQSQSPAAARR